MEELVAGKYRQHCQELNNNNNNDDLLGLLDIANNQLDDEQVSELRNHFFFYAYCLYMERGQTSLRQYLGARRGKYGHVTGAHLQLDRDFFTRPSERITDSVLARPDRDHLIINRIEKLLRVVLQRTRTPDNANPHADPDATIPVFHFEDWRTHWMKELISARMGAYFVEMIGCNTTSTHGNRCILSLERDPNNLNAIIPGTGIQSDDHAINEWPTRTPCVHTDPHGPDTVNDLHAWFNGPHVTVGSFTIDPSLPIGAPAVAGGVYNTWTGLPHMRAAEELVTDMGFAKGTLTEADLRGLVADVEQQVQQATTDQELATLDPLHTLLHTIHASWCASDVDTTISTLRLLSLWVQHPGVKQDVFLLLKGRMGGQCKSVVLLELFLNRVVGKGFTHVVQNPDELTAGFQYFADCLFKVFDDMPALNMLQATALKTQITCSVNEEHKKYAAPGDVPNRCNQAGCTNRDQPHLEADRRTHLLVCSNAMVPADGLTVVRTAEEERRRGLLVRRLVSLCTEGTEGAVAMTALLLLADVRAHDPRTSTPMTDARRDAQIAQAAAAIRAQEAAQQRRQRDLQVIARHQAGLGNHPPAMDCCLAVLVYQLRVVPRHHHGDGLILKRKYTSAEWLGLIDDMLEAHPTLPVRDTPVTASWVGRRMLPLLGSVLWVGRGVKWMPARIRTFLTLHCDDYDPNKDWVAFFDKYRDDEGEGDPDGDADDNMAQDE
jgi:hypothetical protein